MKLTVLLLLLFVCFFFFFSRKSQLLHQRLEGWFPSDAFYSTMEFGESEKSTSLVKSIRIYGAVNIAVVKPVTIQNGKQVYSNNHKTMKSFFGLVGVPRSGYGSGCLRFREIWWLFSLSGMLHWRNSTLEETAAHDKAMENKPLSKRSFHQDLISCWKNNSFETTPFSAYSIARTVQ